MRSPRTTMLTLLLAAFMALGTAPALPRTSSSQEGGASPIVSGAYACRQNTHPWDPENPPGHSHVAGLAVAPSGDLLFHFDGDPLRGPDNHGRGWGITRTFLMRMSPGESVWSGPTEIPYDNPDAAHNTVLWNDGEGRIHNFFTTRQGPNHVHSTLDYRFSDDDGHTWSDPVVLREEWGWMFGNRPFRMSNGELIVPVYEEGAPWGVGFFISDDDFQTYAVHPAEDMPWPGIIAGGLQAATVELEPGHLLAYMRTHARFIYQTESFDYGRTWTPAVPTQFPNPWSRVDLLKTQAGNLVLAYNPSGSDRTPLTLALSEDGGVTWPHEVHVETDPERSYSYPYLIQTHDGAIHMGYSKGEGRTMGHLVFNEEHIRSGVEMASRPDPMPLEAVDGTVRQVEACAYRAPAAEQRPGGMEGAYACRQDIHPQDANFPGVHVATLEQAADGSLLYGFYAGTQEKADDVGTYLSRMPAGRSSWTAPEVIFDEPDKPDGNAVLWVDDWSDRVHLFFSTIMGGGWTEATLRRIHSDDGGRTWSEPTSIREEWGWLFGTRPFRMSNGELIVPIYDEVTWASGWYIPSADLATWTPSPGDDARLWPRSVAGAIQPATVEVGPGHLVAFMRSRDTFIWRTESRDYGRTWSPAVPTTLPNNNSRLDVLQLDSGALLLAHNPTRSGRTPLRLSLSDDGGRSWSAEVDIETEASQEFSYPYLLQGSDGMLHLGYTHRRKSMRHLAFNEEFVRYGADIPSNPAYDVNAEYRDGALRDVPTCAYAAPEKPFPPGPPTQVPPGHARTAAVAQ